MGKEQYLVIDPHGGHNNTHPGVDDGLKAPSEMVKSAMKKGVIPAITGHNTMRGVNEYLAVMKEVGYGDVSLPGVELSYKVHTVGFTEAAQTAEKYGVNIYFGPARSLFGKNISNGNEVNRTLMPEDIQKTREEIIETVQTLISQDPPCLNPQKPKIGFNRATFEMLVLGSDKKLQASAAIYEGLMAVVCDPGFTIFYHDFMQRSKVDQGEDEGISLFLEAPSVCQISALGQYYLRLKEEMAKAGPQKGEIICLMPQEKSFVNKMSGLVDEWREKRHFKDSSLTNLFNFFFKGLSTEEFESLVWHLPHPVSIDITAFGKMITYAKEGNLSLFSPEIFIPEIANLIHTVEILNAAHPGRTNKVAAKLSEHVLFQNKGKAGASDSHDPSWVGSGGTLVKVDKKTTGDILEEMRKGRTIPISGLGEFSKTWIPFFLWLSTIPVGGRNYTPGWVKDRISRKIDIKTPYEKAAKKDIFNNGFSGEWII